MTTEEASALKQVLHKLDQHSVKLDELTHDTHKVQTVILGDRTTGRVALIETVNLHHRAIYGDPEKNTPGLADIVRSIARRQTWMLSIASALLGAMLTLALQAAFSSS